MSRFQRGIAQSWPSFITVMPDDPQDSFHHVYFKNGLDKNEYPVYDFISEAYYFNTKREVAKNHSRDSISFTVFGSLMTIRFCVQEKDTCWRFCKEEEIITSKPGKKPKIASWILGQWRIYS